MKLPTLVATVLSATVLTSLPAISEEVVSKPQPLKCDIGPVSKTYGKTQWLVYSCDDNRSLVFVSAPGNPATPFYFRLSPHEKEYRLTGEGTGSKDATSAAFDELQALSEREIAALIDQTKRK